MTYLYFIVMEEINLILKKIAAAEIAELQKTGKLPTDDNNSATSKENTTPNNAMNNMVNDHMVKQQQQQVKDDYINLQS